MIEQNPMYGQKLSEVMSKASQTAMAHKDTVHFEFNGIECYVDENTDLHMLKKHYDAAHLMGWKEIGPQAMEYSEDLRKEISKRRSEQQEEEVLKNKARSMIYNLTIEQLHKLIRFMDYLILK